MRQVSVQKLFAKSVDKVITQKLNAWLWMDGFCYQMKFFLKLWATFKNGRDLYNCAKVSRRLETICQIQLDELYPNLYFWLSSTSKHHKDFQKNFNVKIKRFKAIKNQLSLWFYLKIGLTFWQLRAKPMAYFIWPWCLLGGYWAQLKQDQQDQKCPTKLVIWLLDAQSRLHPSFYSLVMRFQIFLIKNMYLWEF